MDTDQPAATDDKQARTTAARESNARAERAAAPGPTTSPAAPRATAPEPPTATMSSPQTAEAPKRAPCPCENSAVTLEDLDRRIAAVGRLVLVAIVAAGVAYVLAGRAQDETG